MRVLRQIIRAAWLGGFALTAVASSAAEWRPEKNVEIIIPTSPGGAVDRAGRLLQKLWQEHKLVHVSVSVINKPGGAGVPAVMYLNQTGPNPHLVEIVSAGLLASHITGQSKISHRDLTPLALLASEYYVISVHPNSPLQSGREVIERLKRDPKALSVGIGSAMGGQSHMSLMLALKKAGVDVKQVRTVVFTSSSQSSAALMGGHVDMVPAPASTAEPQIAAGKLRGLAASAPQRLGKGLATVPTWKELGIAAEVANWRAAAGPKGLLEPAVAYWDSVFMKVVETPEWRQDLQRNQLQATYLNSRDTARFLDAEYEEAKSMLTELGLAR
jgi:putative tricarboxylic transport membrane protein